MSETVSKVDLGRRCAAALAACLLLSGCGTFDGRPDRAPTFPAATGEWSLLPESPLTARHEAAGAYLDGRYYVVGGRTDPPCPPAASCSAPAVPALRDAATFDPGTGTWRRIAPAPVPVGGLLQTAVVEHHLYLLTGDSSRDDSPVTFLAYDPGPDVWTTLPAPPGAYPQLVAAGAKVVAVDGTDESTPAADFVFDPRTRRWDRLPEDPLGPSYDRAAAWLGNRLLLTASDIVPNPGADGPSLTRLAVLDESFSRWTLLPDSDIIGSSPVWAAGRVVFPTTGSADGGEVNGWGRDHAYGAILDPATGTWTPLPEPRNGQSGLEGAIGVVGDRTLVGGQLLQPETSTWTRVPRSPWGQGDRNGQTIVTGPGSIFVWGGAAAQDNLGDGYLLPV